MVPVGFYQLLVILIYEEDSDLYLPASFILCSHKNSDIYSKIFQDLRYNVLRNSLEIERMTIDFEDAEKEGIQNAFPDVVLIGCKFHLNQALLRKAKKKGLLKSKNENITKEFIFKINFILENGLNMEEFLQKKESDLINRIQDPSQSSGIIIILKYF